MRIAHLADVHVKDSRRAEYAAVFAELARSLQAAAPDFIAIAGDVFDSMTKVSPNNVADVASLLESLSAVAPVAVIPGNHDMNMYNDEKAVLLDTILKTAGGARHLGNVVYWARSGVHVRHTADGRPVVWVAGAPKDELPDLAEVSAALESEPGAAVVGLFHETVGGARFCNGMEASTPSGAVVPISKGYMSALASAAAAHGAPCAILLGDIHLRQEVTFTGCGDSAAAWYPGSLVCQGFGESHLGHGWLQWDLAPSTRSVTVTPVEIPNPRAHLTVVVRMGEDVTESPLPDAPQAVRLRHDAATPEARVKEIAAEVEARYNLHLRSVGPLDDGGAPAPNEAKVEAKGLAAAQRAADDWERHAAYIRSRLDGSVAPESVDAVVARHREQVQRRLGAERGRPRVELHRLEFDNMYCYGAGNVVDFTALRQGRPGLAGLVAPNRAGKSSLFDILTFALCDATSRGTKQDLTRRGEDAYSLKLEFSIDGIPGRIEKSGQGGRSRGHHTLRFWLGENELTESTTPQTAQKIREHVGSLADIETVVLVRPSSVTGRRPFAAQTPEARRGTLSSLLRLGVFADIKKEVDAEAAELRAELRATVASLGSSGVSGKSGRDVLESACGRAEVLRESAARASAEAGRARAARDAAIKEQLRRVEARAAADANRRVAMAAVETIGAPSDPRDLEAAVEAAAAELDGREVTESQVFEARGRLAMARAEVAAAAARHRRTLDTYGPAWEAAGRPSPPSSEECARLARESEEDPPARWRAATQAEPPSERALAEARAAFAAAQVSPHVLELAAEPEPPRVDMAKYEELLRKSGAGAEAANARVGELAARVRALYATPFKHVQLSERDLAAAEARIETLETRRRQVLAEVETARSVLPLDTLEPSRTTLPPAELDQKLRDLVSRVAKFHRQRSETKVFQSIRGRVQRITTTTRGNCRGCQEITRFLNTDASRSDEVAATELAELFSVAVGALDAELARLKTSVAAHRAHAERTSAATELAEAKRAATTARRVDDVLARTRAKIDAHTEWVAAGAAARAAAAAAAKLEKLEALASQRSQAKTGLAEAVRKAEAAAAAKAARECTLATDAIAAMEEKSKVAVLERSFAEAEELHRLTALVAAGRAALAATEEWTRACAEEASAKAVSETAADRCAAADGAQHSSAVAAERLDASRIEALRSLVERLEVAEAYRSVLDPRKGLSAVLLEEARPDLEAAINQALVSLAASFRVAVGEGFELLLVDSETKAETAPALGSGYQQFALDIAARTALARVAQVPLPACFLIDEGFGCLDAANLSRVGEALAAQASAPGAPLTLAVTHREDLRGHFSHLITISVDGGASRVAWPVGTEAELDATPPPSAALAAPVAQATVQAAALAAAPVATDYCDVCSSMITPGRAANHTETKSHRKHAQQLQEATEIVESCEFATLDGLKVRCRPCLQSLTPRTWARHVRSKKHRDAAK